MEQKRSTNLCSTYILPLLDINKYSFGSVENFIDSYINEDNTLLVAKVKNPIKSLLDHAMFRFNFEQNDYLFYVFEIPYKYQETLNKFREGKYSEFQEEAKSQIKKRSGLSYKVPIGNGKSKSAKELLALDKDKALKSMIEKDLDVKLDDSAELISIPGDDNFYQLNLAKSKDLMITQ